MSETKTKKLAGKVAVVTGAGSSGAGKRTAWDIAEATLFLRSPEARYITAHLLPVDAGVTQRNGG